MQAVREERSIGQLLKELRDETTTLLRQEVDLAKTEMGEKASRVGKNLGSLAVGGGVAFLGALALLAAVIYGLTSILNQFMSVGVAIWLAPLDRGPRARRHRLQPGPESPRNSQARESHSQKNHPDLAGEQRMAESKDALTGTGTPADVGGDPVRDRTYPRRNGSNFRCSGAQNDPRTDPRRSVAPHPRRHDVPVRANSGTSPGSTRCRRP